MTSPFVVGYQGAAGAFSEHALLAAAEAPITAAGFASLEDVGRALAQGTVELGFLPLENTIAGTVTQSYDVISAHALTVAAEVVMPIRHSLLACRGAALETIRRVVSHPVALAQCGAFLERNPAMQASADFDTAGAASRVGREEDPTLAAIAPRSCAARYGLEILEERIEDRADNQTRFAVVASGSVPPPVIVSGAVHRVMIEAELPHEPGALAGLLTTLAAAGHNLTKIEGRPAEAPWTYRFFIELGPSDRPVPTGDPSGRSGRAVRVVGRYPSVRVC
jgi:prephenate dehydratase